MEYKSFILTELFHYYNRYKSTPEELQPTITWTAKSYGFLKETFDKMVKEGLIGVRKSACQLCGNFCGHLSIYLTDEGKKSANHINDSNPI